MDIRSLPLDNNIIGSASHIGTYPFAVNYALSRDISESTNQNRISHFGSQISSLQVRDSHLADY